MPLRVSGKNLDIGESLRRHVVEKVEAVLARYFDGKTSGHVVISPEGSAYRTDCWFHLSSGMNLQAEGRAHEPYASFEQAADKIERRLRRYNKRLKEHSEFGRGGGRPRAQSRQIRDRAAGRARRGAGRLQSGRRRGGLAAAEKPVRRLRGGRTRLDGRAPGRISACGQRAREHRLPPSRRRHRVAGSALERAA